MKNIIRFPRDATAFTKELRKKVNSYFTENNLKKTGTNQLYWKAGFFLTSFFGLAIMLFVIDPAWYLFYVGYAALGFLMAGIGMNVMHDANHGSFSSRKWVNKIMGATIYILAGNSHNWIAQHNLLHHTFTNIEGHDEDIEAGRFIRFSKNAQYYWYNKLQKYSAYTAFLYSLLTINWVITTDWTQTSRFLKDPRVKNNMPKPIVAWTIVVVSKLILFSFWFLLPIVLGVPFAHAIFGFILMHLIAGSILSHIFQLAHINEDAHVITEEQVNDPSFVHQLETTANFGTKSKFLIWYTGGLTHQVEHHLFPNISHAHYPKIASIVRETAKNFNVPYFQTENFMTALYEHYAYIKSLGRKPLSA